MTASIVLGRHALRNTLALAPMAGLTDVPFRALAWRYGAGHVVSEMVSSKPDLWDTGKSRRRRVPVPGVDPVAVQIAGTDPAVMAEAARRHVDDGVEVIDINFGCPAKKVCRKAAGSALLADVGLIARIVAAVAEAVDVPVTIKTRTGLVPGDGRGFRAVEAAAGAGARMAVIHARSRACRFAGPVDFAAVGAWRRRSAVGIPILINGGIEDADGARRALGASGADGVMIGRAAFGRPWIFRELAGGPAPGFAERWRVVEDHVAAMHEFYGEADGVKIARKHIAAYLRGMGMPGAIAAVQRLDSASAQLDALAELARHSAERWSIAV